MQEGATGCRSVALQSCATRGLPRGFTRAALESYATFQSRAPFWPQDCTNRIIPLPRKAIAPRTRGTQRGKGGGAALQRPTPNAQHPTPNTQHPTPKAETRPAGCSHPWTLGFGLRASGFGRWALFPILPEPFPRARLGRTKLPEVFRKYVPGWEVWRRGELLPSQSRVGLHAPCAHDFLPARAGSFWSARSGIGIRNGDSPPAL